MEFQAGTTIEVTSPADICADTVIINGDYSGDGTACGKPLPIELASLTASVAERSVILKWTTATETNNYGFQIERRRIVHQSAGAQEADWQMVAFVQGAGTSTSAREYSYTDKNLSPGRYAYRIRQIDNDGSYAFTAAVEMEVGIPKEFGLTQNYPNPFNPTTTISYALPVRSSVKLQVIDALGRVVAELVDGQVDAGYQQVTWNAQVASGTYFLRIEAASLEGPAKTFTDIKKMVVLR